MLGLRKVRTAYSRAFLALALVSATAMGQNNSSQHNATVQHVEVRSSGDAIEVEIQTSGPISPNTQAIVGPDRIVVDFPGAVPSEALRALKVNRGVLKGVRSGLFFSNPPIARIVLDLTEARDYKISTHQNTTVVRLGGVAAATTQIASTPAASRVASPSASTQRTAASTQVAPTPVIGRARLQTATLATTTSIPGVKLAPATRAAVAAMRTNDANMNVPPVNVPAANNAEANAGEASAESAPAAPEAVPEPPKPSVHVTYEGGMLSIQSDKATLAQVLFEVHQKTQAEIAIPAGAEQEQVVANLGPGPAREILSALLNGSPYNFIFVGEELTLERVILTRRDPSIF